MRKSKAFTFTEVLIAVIIFGIIGGALVATFSIEETVAMRELDMNAKLTLERNTVASIQNLMREQGALRSIEVVTEDTAKTLDLDPSYDPSDLRDPSPFKIALYLDSDPASDTFQHIMVRSYNEEATPPQFESMHLFSAGDKDIVKKDSGLIFELIKDDDATLGNYTLTASITAEDYMRGIGVSKHAVIRKIALAYNEGEAKMTGPFPKKFIWARLPICVTPLPSTVPPVW